MDEKWPRRRVLLQRVLDELARANSVAVEQSRAPTNAGEPLWTLAKERLLEATQNLSKE